MHPARWPWGVAFPWSWGGAGEGGGVGRGELKSARMVAGEGDGIAPGIGIDVHRIREHARAAVTNLPIPRDDGVQPMGEAGVGELHVEVAAVGRARRTADGHG